MPDNLLSDPAFAALRDHNKALVLEALDDPKRKDEIVVSTLLALHQDAVDARDYCRDECQPGLTAESQKLGRRVSRLERFKAWLLGVGAALVIGGGAIYGIVELVKALTKGG
ncbi:MAG: hypothetical protein FD189_1109 [Elusimicrobia bacterium]|nr:MAG: hypothetical protein FD189_1109 [Elusimicrobiota bacterium]